MDDRESSPDDGKPGCNAWRAAAEDEVRTGINEAMVRRLALSFNDRVRADPLPDPVFEARLADWAAHLARMYAFWSSAAPVTGRDHGRPMQAPVAVDAKRVDRRLALLEAAARQSRPPAAPALFIEKARLIAQSLEFGIATYRGRRLTPASRLPSSSGNELSQP